MNYRKLFPTVGFKGNILLLLTGLVVSGFVWLYWYYTGEYGIDILATMFLIGLIGDNYILRKELKKLREELKK